MTHGARLCGSVFLAVITSASTALPQTLQVGALGKPVSYFTGVRVQTIVDTSFSANRDGSLISAVFQWSNAPCPAAAKIKVFRSDGNFAHFVDERGPFDVDSRTVRVFFEPALPIRKGDWIGVTNVTTCGGVALRYGPGIGRDGDSHDEINLHPPLGTFPPPTAPILRATDSQGLLLLGDRFNVSMVATDPRTGSAAEGLANRLGESAGYFSLPEFTGDPTLPEVTVKMADATGSAALGGTFWFFHSALTDVAYTLTVRDHLTGRTRAYSNGAGATGQLCGEADTNAFRP